MDEQNERKKGRGHPPWTEAQKQARRELNAKKRAERAAEEKRQEANYAAAKNELKSELAKARNELKPSSVRAQSELNLSSNAEQNEPKKKKRDGKGGKWFPEMYEANRAGWAKKQAKVDAERKQLIADNPTKTKKELGIPGTWKPRDGSDDGYITKYMREARVSIDLPPINVGDPKQVKQRIEEYLDFCEQNNKIPQLPGLANWLGVPMRTLDRWKTGVYREDTHQPLIQRTVMLIEEIWVDMMQNNRINPANGIFLAKNLLQYKDQTDIAVAPREDKIKSLSDAEIADWYSNDQKVETDFVDDAEHD